MSASRLSIIHATLSNISHTVIQYILGFTLYDMMRASQDFEDVKAELNDRIDRLIELFRSSFAIHLSNGSYFFMLSTLFFLVMAESIHLSHGRLSATELRERAEYMGYAAFALFFAVLDIGFVIVRVAAIVTLSESPALATGLVLISMSPSAVFPMLAYPARLFNREAGVNGEEDMESGTRDGRTRN